MVILQKAVAAAKVQILKLQLRVYIILLSLPYVEQICSNCLSGRTCHKVSKCHTTSWFPLQLTDLKLHHCERKA